MTKSITILAIATALVIGTSITLAEGAVWPGFQDIGFSGGTEFYRISETIKIPPGESGTINLVCPGSDIYIPTGLGGNTFPSPDDYEFDGSDTGRVNGNLGNLIRVQKGFKATIDNVSPLNPQLVEMTFEMFITCARINPIAEVGGEGISVDTTSLFLAYGIANSVWMAPIAIGVGAGVYLTRNKWKR